MKIHFSENILKNEYKKITFSKPVRRTASLSCSLLDFQDNRRRWFMSELIVVGSTVTVENLPFKHSFSTVILIIVIVIIVIGYMVICLFKRM